MNKSQDEIKVHEDKTLLDLEGHMAILESEKVNFILSDITVNEKGRTMQDVGLDKISIFDRTNLHLQHNYKDNSVAKSWIAVNTFSADRLREVYS